MRSLKKPLAVTLLLSLFYQFSFPCVAYALTGGPSQPEAESFEPISTTEMVDLTSGDLTYNIPLLDVGGYPINLAYHSGISMDQEASWVGLGWNINPGVINRTLRNVPDDFNGDQIEKQMRIKPHTTVGLSGSLSYELVGFEFKKVLESLKLGISAEIGVLWDSYKGFTPTFSLGPTMDIATKNNSRLTAGLGLSFDKFNGTEVSPSVNFAKQSQEGGSNNSTRISLASSFSGREGVKALQITAHTKYANIDGPITFVSPSYLSSPSNPSGSAAFTFDFKFGGELPLLATAFTAKGSFTTNWIEEKSFSYPGYGYQYPSGITSETILEDFTRDKDGGFMPTTPNLPVASSTYDLYNASGQGVSGQFKPMHGRVGMHHERKSSTHGGQLGFGLEASAGVGVHLGGNIHAAYSESKTNGWINDNALASSLSFYYSPADITANPNLENTYFKNTGDLVPEKDTALYKKFGGIAPYRPTMGRGWSLANIGNGSFGESTVSKYLYSNTGKTPASLLSDSLKRTARQGRNEVYEWLTAKDAGRAGTEKRIYSYPANKSRFAVVRDSFERASGGRKAHHTSQVTITKPDGSRYVYGLPAYNNFQKDVTFSVAAPGTQPTDGLVGYDTTKDNSVQNRRGRDQLYQSTKLPNYSHSHLLTALLSSDYSDRTGDGISDDDPGNYTRFNYTRKHSGYRWRTPVNSGKANYQRGQHGDPEDDKASYVYGEKEVWYMHSIESRLYIAEFRISPRQDSYGVRSENGGADFNQPLYKLDTIVLYLKSERKLLGNNAQPLKTVLFNYSYELCPNVPNNKGDETPEAIYMNLTTGTWENQDINELQGKLTLKSVRILHGYTKKGLLSAYKFGYGTLNPEYNSTHYDRWGNYMTPDNSVIPVVNNADFPYTRQKDTLPADAAASAWHLNKIKLPSGGVIHINYEADDYASVQNLDAMMMTQVVGAGNTPVTADDKTGVEGTTDNLMLSQYGNYPYLYFKLMEPIPTTTAYSEANELFKQQYVRDLVDTTLYYKLKIALTGTGEWEYMSNFAHVKSAGLVQTPVNGSYRYGYIEVKTVHIGDREKGGEQVNPICKAAWQFVRMHRPELVFTGEIASHPGADPGQDDKGNFATRLQKTRQGLTPLFQQYYKKLRDHGFGQKMDVSRSWIRLYHPTKKKMGGGSRVSRTAFSNNWSSGWEGTTNTEFAYVSRYDYTTVDKNDNKTISSGVASYEPLIGGEENPFRQPIPFSDRKVFVPDNDYFQETPLGESFFPGPCVIYSKVKVKAYGCRKNGVHVTDGTQDFSAGVGHTIHEFYTARDFPTLALKTDLQIIRKRPNPILKFLRINSDDQLSAAQGFSIVQNDMPGKPKAERVFAEGNPYPISEKEYFYRTTPGDPTKLDNRVTVLNDEGVSSSAVMGVDIEIFADSREGYSKTLTVGISPNADIWPFPPIPIPAFWPMFGQDKTEFRSVSMTKLVMIHGLLESVRVTQDGAALTTTHLAYDGNTGQVLLSKLQNEYGKQQYTMNFPAYWFNSGMAGSVANAGAYMPSAYFDHNSNKIKATNLHRMLRPGDEVLISSIYTSNFKRGWVEKVQQSGSWHNATIIDGSGALLTMTNRPVTVKVIRSGYRNQQSTIAGSIATLDNPLAGTTLDFDGLRILSAQFNEFSDQWDVYGVNVPGAPQYRVRDQVNPYLAGIKGNYRVAGQYLIDTSRVYGTSHHLNGYFLVNNLWDNATGYKPWLASPTQWRRPSTATLIDPFGHALEERDTLSNYSAETYGFNHRLVTAAAKNARHSDIAYESFEDYASLGGSGQSDSLNAHFSFIHAGRNKRCYDTFHTGRYSLKLTNECVRTVMTTAYSIDSTPPNGLFWVRNQDIIKRFTPRSGKYFGSVWIRMKDYRGRYTYSDLPPPMRIVVTNSSNQKVQYVASPSSKLIDGWQQYTLSFDIPPGYKALDAVLCGGDPGGGPMYFDDFRIYPSGSNMKSFAYDPATLRLLATLDENNYATVYEYDEEGRLVHVKLETEEGLLTVKETRMVYPKKYTAY